MEKQTFKTLIKKDHQFSGSEYVEGRILGIAEIICDLYGGTEERPDKDGNLRTVHIWRGGYRGVRDDETFAKFLSTRCTAEQYETFKQYVEGQYPGLCEFYWEPEN